MGVGGRVWENSQEQLFYLWADVTFYMISISKPVYFVRAVTMVLSTVLSAA